MTDALLSARDLSTRYPDATLYGYDLTPAMVDHAKRLAYAGAPPTLSVHDVTKQPDGDECGVAKQIFQARSPGVVELLESGNDAGRHLIDAGWIGGTEKRRQDP